MATLQDDKLLAKDEILNQQSATRPKEATKGAYPKQKQVEHSGELYQTASRSPVVCC